MQPSMTIRKMLTEQITVPTYQRSYSWEKKHISVFLSDLEAHKENNTDSSYYFGHFLFEKAGQDNTYHVIDGQQRITTIVVCLSALFECLKTLRNLSEDESFFFEDTIMRREQVKFHTVSYDDRDFKDYIIQKKKDIPKVIKMATNSATRFLEAFHYFTSAFKKMDEPFLTDLLSIIGKASCSTHLVEKPSEAIQMFIFQNDRGKKPTELEIIKSKFMYHIHLKAVEDKEDLLKEMSERFEHIYKNISKIDDYLEEDDVIRYVSRMHWNDLRYQFTMEKIDKGLAEEGLPFIKAFSLSIDESFECLETFIQESRTAGKNFAAHSLLALGKIGIAYPFIIKAYQFALEGSEKSQLFTALENILLRHRLVSTRAELEARLADVYREWTKDNKSIEAIVSRIEWMKDTNEWWWGYWSNENVETALHSGVQPATALYLLGHYENSLRQSITDYPGYDNSYRFDAIAKKQCEHIAPQTPTNGEPVAAGYCTYNEDFKNRYLNSLGNYLLISESHNKKIGNISFAEKAATYSYLKQQEEVKAVHDNGEKWNKKAIQNREQKIIDFIKQKFF